MSFVARVVRVSLLLAVIAAHAAVSFAQCPTSAPTVVAPSSGAANLSQPITLKWSAQAGVSKYDVFVNRGASCSSTPTNLFTATGNQFNLPTLDSGTQYAWTVLPIDPQTNQRCAGSTAMSCATFTTAAAAICNLPGSFNLTAPVDKATLTSTPTLTWSAAPNADKYIVHYGTGQSPASASGAVATTSYTPPPLPAGTYFWYVDAFAVCDTAHPKTSSIFSFTIGSSCPTNPGTPSLTSPSQGATITSPVTFQWTAVTGAKGYSVLASVGEGSRYTVGTTTSTSLTATMPQGKISWTVVAGFGDSCPTTVANTSSFTVSTPTTCSATPATLIAPAHSASNVTSPVTFQWSAVPGAAGYVLHVAANDLDFEDVAETTSTSVTKLMPAGLIHWYVETKFASCASVNSATDNFTIPGAASCDDQTISVTAPADNAAVTSPVTFSWSAVSGATVYRVWAGVDNGGAPVNVATTTQTSATVVLPSGRFEWYVEALRQGCTSLTSQSRKFTIAALTNCGANAAPVAVAPSGDSSESVTFRWNGSSSAIGYRVWVAASGQPFADVGFTKDDHLTQTVAAGTYSWYVEAYYEGCAPLKSSALQFTIASSTPQCSGDAPNLVIPASNATTVASPVRMVWTPVSGAIGYRVYASAQGTDGKLVLIGETDGDTPSLVRPLPAGSIQWRVEALFAKCASTKSGIGSFVVAQSPNCPATGAQPLAPADGATVTSQPVDFNWSAVSGAAGYVLVVRVNDGAATAVTETTDTQFSHTLPEGSVEWWVVTFVAGCGQLESQHAHFTIPVTTCGTQRPLLITPLDGDEVAPSVTFRWTPVPNATKYRLWAVDSDLQASVLATTTAPAAIVTLPAGRLGWFVEAEFANCPPIRSAANTLRVSAAGACATPKKVTVTAPGQVVSGSTYTIRWTSSPNAGRYELQEAIGGDFANATTTSVNETFSSMSRTTTSAPLVIRYRVRAVSNCSDERGPYSDVVTVVVMPPAPPSKNQQAVSAEFGANSSVTQTLFLPGQQSPVNFTATSDKPWITITPSSGTLPTTGLTLTITANPASLNLGTNSATIRVTYAAAGASSTHAAASATTVTSVPLSVSLVTPVTPAGKNTPPPDSLIIPAVGHAAGVGDSLFESDIRVANTSATAMKYLVNFTPSGTDGTATSTSTTIQVDPGQTLALDDILASFFGTTTSAIGMLEIRPLTSTASTSAFTSSANSRVTVASSRTYNVTPTGTFGQFIPAIPFSQFIGSADGVLSLQQIAQSPAYRTNFGLVEGAGEPASVTLKVFDNAGALLGTIQQSLKPSEHVQLNALLAANNITLADGRVEVQVTSSTGRVSAYASTVDNITGDPLMVSPVLRGSTTAARYVLPGVGDFNAGFAHWKSDVRIFNGGASDANVTLSYYPQGHAEAPITSSMSVKAGEVKAIDNFIAATIPAAGTNTAGSLLVTSASSSSLVVTGRTYTDTGNGTYGQFIPAVTVADSVGLGERTLQILQLEQSTRMRTNVGVVETSGNTVNVEVSVLLPDSRVTPKVTLTLAANEFTQLPLAGLVPDGTYNARVAVRVTGGSGKVTAYGSVIDQVTQDPTYVPAQ